INVCSFDTLYETGEDFLKFYLSVVQNKEGIVYVHHVNTEIPYTFDDGYCMDWEQFDKVKDVFFDSLHITVVPLVADYGKIYEKIKSLCKENMTLLKPLLADENAVEVLLKDCVNPVVIVHPRTDKQLMNRLKQYADVYLLKEPIVADEKQHDVIIGLVTHGTHYQDVKNTIDKAIREGAKLNDKGTILQQKPFTEYLMKSVKKS
ncbi:MAG: hypothetical protein HUJ58_03900, partial [Erysipelotrichaceae bacterium]|nr:hypothetical protein [Erysipelotrichaceae bacterium]